jgi:hypothetical protein
VKLTTHLHLVPRSTMVDLNLHSPICLHGTVLNYAQGQMYIFLSGYVDLQMKEKDHTYYLADRANRK